MVDVGGLRKLQDRLQHTVDRGGVKQVVAARDMGDRLQGVIVDDGDVVAGADVLAGQDDITPGRRLSGNGAGLAVRAGAKLAKGEVGPGSDDGLGHVEAQGIGLAGRHSALALLRCQQAAMAGVYDGTIGIARALVGGELRTGAEARVEQAQAFKPVDDGDVVVHVARLAANRLRPVEAQP